MKRYLPFAIIGLVFVAALGGGALFFHYRNQPPPKPAFGKPGAEPPHIRGSAKAAVALEEFGDFECLPCSVLWSTLKKIEEDYGARLSATFREYPLTKHRLALDAARAAEAAGLQGRFWEMHDLLYENRLRWINELDARPLFSEYAATLKLDIDRFNKDRDGEEVTQRIALDRERAASVGVDRTPTVFINGAQVPSSLRTVEGLHAAIDAALNRQNH